MSRGEAIEGGGRSSTYEWDVDVVGRKEGTTMDFHAGKFKSQHNHTMSEFQWTLMTCRFFEECSLYYPYLCHHNLYSSILYTMSARPLFCCMCVPLVLVMGIRTKVWLLSWNLKGATAWGVGQNSDPVVTRIFQVSKVMNVLGQQSMATTTQAINSTEFA